VDSDPINGIDDSVDKLIARENKFGSNNNEKS
jgi:hypothetical protein